MAKKEQEREEADQEESQEETPEAAESKDGENTYIETNIDKLYDLIGKKRSISFLEAADHFDVEKEQIASWAKILEDHKLAKVHYPVFGTPIIFAKEAEIKKIFGEEEEHAKKKPGSKGPKLMVIVLAGALLLFFGYVMILSNPFTISIRSQIAGISGRVLAPFSFLRYPLNIIIPLAIILAVAWIAFSVRRKRRRKSDEQKEIEEAETEEDEPKKEKGAKKSETKEKKREARPKEGGESKGKENDIEDKIDRIKERLGS